MNNNPQLKDLTPEERMAIRIKEAREYAARYHLEEYLDKPGDMSHMMLKMYELMSKIQRIANWSKNLSQTESHIDATIKKYGNGKFVLYFHKRGAHDQAARDAFYRSVDLYTILDHSKFMEEMRQRGIPEEAALEYLEDYYIDDECYGTDRPER